MTSADERQRRRMSMPSVATLSLTMTSDACDVTNSSAEVRAAVMLREKRKKMFRRSVSSSFDSTPEDDVTHTKSTRDVTKTEEVASLNGDAKKKQKKKVRALSLRRRVTTSVATPDVTPPHSPSAEQALAMDISETAKRGRRGSLPASIMSATWEASLRRFRFKKSRSTDRMTQSPPKSRRGRLFSVSVRLPSGFVSQVSSYMYLFLIEDAF